MSTALLRTENNQRVDKPDFDFLSESIRENTRHIFQNFLVNPVGAIRSWIIRGFEISNPAGKQLQIEGGSAILPMRDGADVLYGMLLTTAEAKVVDLTSYAPGTYQVYIRFEYVDADLTSRIFWNPTAEEEYAKNVATRQAVSWSIAVEAANPGDEWFRIAQVDQATMAITDRRNLFFEGGVEDSYIPQWPGANDRDPDRSTYGLKDLQAFVRMCQAQFEEIKGGNQRWWEAGFTEISYSKGINVGYASSTYGDNEVRVGNPLFALRAAADDIDMDILWGEDGVSADIMLRYERDNELLKYIHGAVEAMTLTKSGGVTFAAGGTFGTGLRVGVAGTPIANAVVVGDLNFGLVYSAGEPQLQFDLAGTDALSYVRGDNKWKFSIAGALRAAINNAGLNVPQGLSVGYVGDPADDTIHIGDANFRLYWTGTVGALYFQTGTLITGQAASWQAKANNVQTLNALADRLYIGTQNTHGFFWGFADANDLQFKWGSDHDLYYDATARALKFNLDHADSKLQIGTSADTYLEVRQGGNIVPIGNGLTNLGSMLGGELFESIFCYYGSFLGIWSTILSDAQALMHTRHNAISAKLVVTPSETIEADSWNINTGTSGWDVSNYFEVNFIRPLADSVAFIITPGEGAASQYVATYARISNSQIQVYIRTRAAGLVERAAFSLVAVGTTDGLAAPGSL